MLGTLDHLVGKAQDAGMADDVLGLKLTEDMFPLELQFRVALNQVLLALNQVAGKTLPRGSHLPISGGGPRENRSRALTYRSV